MLYVCLKEGMKVKSYTITPKYKTKMSANVYCLACLYKKYSVFLKYRIWSPVHNSHKRERCVVRNTWCGYKITGLMLQHLLFKKLHNRNVVTLNVFPSAIHTPLHANFPLLEAMLQVVF